MQVLPKYPKGEYLNGRDWPGNALKGRMVCNGRMFTSWNHGDDTVLLDEDDTWYKISSLKVGPTTKQ